MIKLHLLQEIQYQAVLPAEDLLQAYGRTVSNLFDIPVGVELCFDISYECEDGICFHLERLARKDPPTAEDKMAVDSLRSIPKVDNPLFRIPVGEYGFEQLLILPEPDDLVSVLCRFCTRSGGRLYLRIMREKAMEFVAQVLVNN